MDPSLPASPEQVPQQDLPKSFPQQQDSLISPPSIVVDDFSAHSPFGGSTNLPIHSADNGSDPFVISSPAISDHASLSIDDQPDSSGYNYSNPSGYDLYTKGTRRNRDGDQC